jgi:hypothetical protein
MYRPKISKFQILAHAFLMIGGWGIYAYGLTRLQDIPSQVYQAVAIVLGLEAIFLISLTISWIIHHLSIHRTLGPRKMVTPAVWHYERDWSGYNIVGNFDDLKHQQVIIVTCDPETKLKVFQSEKKTHD